MDDDKHDELVRWPTPDEVLEHVRAGGRVDDAFDFGRPTSPLEFATLPIDASEAAFLEARQVQRAQITREIGIPAALLRESPDNPRRRYVGLDLASGPDQSVVVWATPAGTFDAVKLSIRLVCQGFERFAAELGAAAVHLTEAGEAWRRFGWALMTPAQRRRHGKRLIREEIARRRMEKNRAA